LSGAVLLRGQRRGGSTLRCARRARRCQGQPNEKASALGLVGDSSELFGDEANDRHSVARITWSRDGRGRRPPRRRSV